MWQDCLSDHTQNFVYVNSKLIASFAHNVPLLTNMYILVLGGPQCDLPPKD